MVVLKTFGIMLEFEMGLEFLAAGKGLNINRQGRCPEEKKRIDSSAIKKGRLR